MLTFLRHGIISSCQSAATSEIVKCCCSSLVSSAITSTQTFTRIINDCSASWCDVNVVYQLGWKHARWSRWIWRARSWWWNGCVNDGLWWWRRLRRSRYLTLIIIIIVIPHVEMRACDWSKSRHVTFTKSGYFAHQAILPPLLVNIDSIMINIASMSSLIFINNS